MGPDWYWTVILSLGGIAIGFVTSLIRLPKGREVYGWLALYAFMVLVVAVLDLRHPFWTVFWASLGAGLGAAAVQLGFKERYWEHNDWAADDLGASLTYAAIHFVGFAVASGIVFGFLVGAVAWGIAAL